jgi:ferric enterobactin receptor
MQIKTNNLTIYIILLFLTIIPFVSKGQGTITLKGHLVDAETGQPFAFANLALYDKGLIDTIRTYSTEDGTFRFLNLDPGEYRLEVSWLGHNLNFSTIIRVKDSVPEQDLGTFPVIVPPHLLDEITVISRELISQEADRLVYHVDRDQQQAFATVMGIMEKVPLLSVVGTEQLRYLGSTSYTIHIDGKPSSFTSGNVTEMLKHMPASSIRKIEVITSPSARYLDEGIEAIINIETKKRLYNGMEGSMRTEYRTPPAGPGVGLNGDGKFGTTIVSVAASGSNYNAPASSYSLLRQSTADEPYSLLQEGSESRRTNNLNTSASLLYEKDSLNLFSFRTAFAKILENRMLENRSFMEFEDNYHTEESMLESESRSLYRDGMIGSDYQRNFASRSDRILNISYLYAFWKDNTELHNTITGQPGQESQNISIQNEHSAQLDYTQAIGSSRLEIGSKWISRAGKSDFNEYRNRQQMVIVYASSRYRLGKVNFIGGLRYEYTGYQNRMGNERMRADFDNLIPNLTVNWAASQGLSFQTSYMKTIRRPNVSYLNPFIQIYNPQMRMVGNPDLKPVETDNINVQLRRTKKGTLVVNLRYAHSKNTIRQLYMNSNEPGVALYKMANIGKQRDLTLLISYQQTLFTKLSFSFSGNVKRTNLAANLFAEGHVKRSGYQWTGLAGVQYYPKPGLNVGLRYQYDSPILLLQGTSSQMPYMVGTASKNFLSNKLTISTILVNPFSKYFSDIREAVGNSYSQIEYNQVYSRQFQISLLYRFGLLKEFVRTQRKTIENTDAIGKN